MTMEITKSWVMTEEYMETISFDKLLVELFIKQKDIHFDKEDGDTIESIADEYSDELWEWAVENSQTEFIKDLYEYEDHQEPIDGFVNEYRFQDC